LEAGAALLRDGAKLKEKRLSRMVVVKVLTHGPTVLPFCRKNHIEFLYTQSTSDLAALQKALMGALPVLTRTSADGKKNDREKNVVLFFNSGRAKRKRPLRTHRPKICLS
jgi:hypothetical protein